MRTAIPSPTPYSATPLAPERTIPAKQEAMPSKAWLPVFEPGAGRQRLPGVQRAAPLARNPEAERSGPRHFAGFRRKTESVIVGSYTFAESAAPPSPRAPNEPSSHPRKKGGASMARNDGVDRTTVRNQPRTESNIADAEAHNERQKACYRNEDIVPERSHLILISF